MISNLRVFVKRFFRGPDFRRPSFFAANALALSKNPAKISEDRVRVKRFFSPRRFFLPGSPWPAPAAPRTRRPVSAARLGPRRPGKFKKRRSPRGPPGSGKRPPSTRSTPQRLPKEPAAPEAKFGNGQNGNDFYRIEPRLSIAFFPANQFFGRGPATPPFIGRLMGRDRRHGSANFQKRRPTTRGKPGETQGGKSGENRVGGRHGAPFQAFANTLCRGSPPRAQQHSLFAPPLPTIQPKRLLQPAWTCRE
jgi:hypothetical protein